MLVRPQSRRPGRGYTLVEMLVVLAIVSILAGLVMAALSAARRHSMVQRTEALLISLRAKVNEYETDFHDYPKTDGDDALVGGERLLAELGTKEKNGPYLSLGDLQTCDENGNGVREIADAFGKAIRYLHHRSYGRENPNRRTYRLWSVGADGVDEPLNPSSDDLGNWKKGQETNSEE
jgi:prepilin-type N-terminal cleavage/methylation domain-containing protein